MQEYAVEYADIWHSMPTRFERSGGIWLVRAGRNRGKENYMVGPKQIECYGFHFILDGQLQLNYEDQTVSLRGGDLFCLFPGVSYVYSSVGEETLRMTWLSLDGPQTRELLKLAGITEKQPYRRGGLSHGVQGVLSEIEGAIWQQSSSPRTILSKRKLALIARLHHLFEQLELGIDSGPEEQAPSSESWVEEALYFMQLHYAEALRVEQVARRFGLHRSHFSQYFSQKTGLSPQQFLLQLRIGRAQQLLTETDLSVGEIAQSVGYPDLYMFSRAFKRESGVSPSEYRKAQS